MVGARVGATAPTLPYNGGTMTDTDVAPDEMKFMGTSIKIKARASGSRREDGLTSAQVEAEQRLARQKDINDGA